MVKKNAAILILPCMSLQIFMAPIVSAQENPYTYVKMSLLFPWAMYFFFLGAVLIPFVVMIGLAWRRQQDPAVQNKDDTV